MPGSLFDADTSFPRFTGEETDSEKIQKLQDYLYQLTENFRYLMSNLGIENFNADSLDELGTTIRKPVLVTVEKQAGETEKKITLIETNIGKDIKGIKTQVKDLEGNVATNQSTIEQTAKTITAKVEDIVAGKTKISLDPYALKLESITGEDGGSYLVLTSNGTEISSPVINLDGFVTFTSDDNGETYIDGATLKTGTIDAGTIIGGTIYGGTIYGNLEAKSGLGYSQGTISGAVIESVYDGKNARTGKIVFLAPVADQETEIESTQEVASIHYDDNGGDTPENNKNRLFIKATNGAAIKLESGAGISVVAEGTVHIEAPNINLVTPGEKGIIDIGSVEHPATVRVNGNVIS